MHICFKCEKQIRLVNNISGGIPFNFNYPIYKYTIELIIFEVRDHKNLGFSSLNKRKIIFHIWNPRRQPEFPHNPN